MNTRYASSNTYSVKEVLIELTMKIKLDGVGNVCDSQRTSGEGGWGGGSRGRKYEGTVVGGYRPTFSPLKKCLLKSHLALQLSLAFYFAFSFFPPKPSSFSFLLFYFFFYYYFPYSPANVKLLTPEEGESRVQEKREAEEEEEEEG